MEFSQIFLHAGTKNSHLNGLLLHRGQSRIYAKPTRHLCARSTACVMSHGDISPSIQKILSPQWWHAFPHQKAGNGFESVVDVHWENRKISQSSSEAISLQLQLHDGSTQSVVVKLIDLVPSKCVIPSTCRYSGCNWRLLSARIPDKLKNARTFILICIVP